MRLRNSTIVVTGASNGLGRAMATAYAEEGARVVCASRSADRLSTIADELSEREGTAVAIPTDVRSWEDVRSLVRETTERVGEIDVFVNNAGITQLNVAGEPSYRPVSDVPVDAWDAILETNLRGPFLCTKAVLPGMLERDSGRLIHVSSGHGIRAQPNRSPYVASKFGLEGLHETVSRELEGTGVDSIALRPPDGGVYTERKGENDTSRETYRHESPTVIAKTAVRLAAGEGENGGRYVARADGETYTTYATGDDPREE
ncbi:SDR family NAD(P)-dependent oxidoreductase [Natrarchaeobius oligotrophus]|uniref:SDR family oxidoreductase n=1 Tax=Natrarchaeobius chitinivorans TaxID=1679083 RepID=A0A3N6MED2_NATCH|nr:SDR family oxidoreductase [Natrarchaeobius chitinivorans]RQH02324.1 SDR family oxidoreductase [Natrarchaeobius chitinivorans]